MIQGIFMAEVVCLLYSRSTTDTARTEVSSDRTVE